MIHYQLNAGILLTMGHAMFGCSFWLSNCARFVGYHSWTSVLFLGCVASTCHGEKHVEDSAVAVSFLYNLFGMVLQPINKSVVSFKHIFTSIMCMQFTLALLTPTQRQLAEHKHKSITRVVQMERLRIKWGS